MKNPFQVIGLDIFELKTLKIDQLKMIINSQYRALQKCHHPDLGGSEKKSRLLNWAKEELLSDDKKLIDWIERLSSKKTAIEAMKEKVNNYAILAVFYRSLLLSLYSSLIKINRKGNYVNLLGISEDGIKVCRSLTMKQQDTLLTGLGSEIEDEEERRLFRQAERQKMINMTFFSLMVSNGSLIEINCEGKQKDISNRLLIGVITSETIRKKFNGSMESIIKFLAKICPKPKNNIELAYQGDYDKNKSSDFLSREQLIKLLPFLSCQYEEGGWLFSLSLDDHGKLIGRLEGQIFNKVHQAKVIKKS